MTKKEKALDLYIKGKYSLEKAAKFADLYIGEFLELMEEKGIERNLTIKDFNESFKHAKNLKFKK